MTTALLFIADLGEGQMHQWMSAATGWLTAEELARAEQLSPTARLRHTVGRSMIRLLGSQAVGISDPRALTVAVTEAGKPFLPQAADLRVSVAHSDRSVAAAAVLGADIGVDVDSLTRHTPDVHRLAARLFAPDEVTRLAGLDPVDAGTEFMRYWIIKEAVGKALGTGYVPAMRGAELEPVRTNVDAEVQLRLRSVWAGPAAGDWTLHCRDVAGGDESAVVAIAAPGVALRPLRAIEPATLEPETFAPGF